MDQKLKLHHEVETCVALVAAVSAMLGEIIDLGGPPSEGMDKAVRVLGLLQDRLDVVQAMADSAIHQALA